MKMGIDDMKRELPWPMLEAKWLRLRDWKPSWVETIIDEYDRAWRKPGWNPKLIRLSGDTFMVDMSSDPDDQALRIGENGRRTWAWSPYAVTMPSAVKVIEYEDHPFLRELPQNAPRAVRSIYTKEVRLKYLRMTDASTFVDDMNSAETSWAKYLSGITHTPRQSAVCEGFSADQAVAEHPQRRAKA